MRTFGGSLRLIGSGKQVNHKLFVRALPAITAQNCFVHVSAQLDNLLRLILRIAWEAAEGVQVSDGIHGSPSLDLLSGASPVQWPLIMFLFLTTCLC